MSANQSNSAVNSAAQRIRQDVLEADDGQFLGSEDDLVTRYKVSRPTLRQAASLVAQEQLLTVRRGVGGGYFARQPDVHAVSRMVALYLKAHRAKVSEIVSAFMPIRIGLARMASFCEDENLRLQLAEFLQHEKEVDNDFHFRDFVIGERKFNLLLGKMSNNKALALFLEALLDLAAMVDRGEDMYRNRLDRMTALRQERNRLAAAVLDKDEEMSVLAARRCAQLSAEWLMEDLEKRSEIASPALQELATDIIV